MKKILGLDLGVSSIGWAFIHESDNESVIVGGGVRIVPLTTDEKDEFTSGNAISKNMKRAMRRGARRNLFRFRLRKHHLRDVFQETGILPDASLFTEISKTDLWGLRSSAVTEKISLQELARVLFHLNQKRGFKSNRKAGNEEEDGKKLSDYKAEIKSNQDELQSSGMTIGQFFYARLLENPSYRIKGKVFPRAVYLDEFERIWEHQSGYYPAILTEDLKRKIRDEIIFYQRRLRSQKALVSRCTFEGGEMTGPNGKKYLSGPRVAPISSPLHQYCKIWESVHNLRIRDAYGKEITLSLEQKKEIVDRCNDSATLSATELMKILRLPKGEKYQFDASVKNKGLQGNTTVAIFRKAFEKHSVDPAPYLEMPLEIREVEVPDKQTGEIFKRKVMDEAVFNTPLYRLWHAVYSIEEDDDLVRVLTGQMGLPEPLALELAKLDLTKAGFSSKSARAMRKILPGLLEGLDYTGACLAAGYRHSKHQTKSENLERQLAAQIELLKKGALRQPVVERILNQLINLVNALMADEKYGRPDEVRIEMARELKQNMQQRNRTFKQNNDRDKAHKKIAETLTNEYGFRKVTRALIEKYKLYMETDGISLYTGKRMELSKVLNGEDIDIDHIVPKSLLFDDSFNNRTLCEGAINRAKGNMTAFEFMKSQPVSGLQDFESYMEMLAKLKEKKDGITFVKYDRFVTDQQGIPQEFVERQLRQTAYICRKAAEILKHAIRDVYFTSGQVTDFLREKWGWNNVLKNLNWSVYEAMGKTTVTSHNHRIIEGWTKRDDHRHHFIDALVVACTRQKYIQALNNLSQVTNSVKTLNLPTIDRMIAERPFTTAQVEDFTSGVFISMKRGKRLASRSRNKITNQTTLIPRGPLSEETIYGKIKVRDKVEVSLNAKYDVTQQIADRTLRKIVLERLQQFNNDPALAFKKPLYLDAEQTQAIKKVPVWNFKEEYVVKYKVETLKAKDIPYVVDEKVREKLAERLAAFNGNEKEAFKNYEDNPVYMDADRKIPVRTVRMFTGLSKVEAIRRDAQGRPLDFVKPGNNLYFLVTRDAEGKLEAVAITFMEAFERRKQGDTLENALQREGKQLLMKFEANEYYILGLNTEEINRCKAEGDLKMLAKHTYRVQKFSGKGNGDMEIVFRQQYQTKLDDSADAKISRAFYSLRGLNKLFETNPVRITTDLLGQLKASD